MDGAWGYRCHFLAPENVEKRGSFLFPFWLCASASDGIYHIIRPAVPYIADKRPLYGRKAAVGDSTKRALCMPVIGSPLRISCAHSVRGIREYNRCQVSEGYCGYTS